MARLARLIRSRYARLVARSLRERAANVSSRSGRATRLNLVSLEDRLVPTGRPLPYPVLFAGTESGSIPVVKAYDAESGKLNFEVKAYESAFTGGVRVAAADVNRDTYPDVVVAPGPGGGPRIRVLDGKTGEQFAGPLGNFFAFEEDFTGGLSVAGADVNGDGYPDVIVAAGQGGGPRVRVFSGADGTVLADFFAFEADFRGGMTVAAADVTGDGRAELVVGAGQGGGPRVRVLDVIAIDETATARERTLNAIDGAATARERSEPATAPLPARRQDPTPVPGALGDFFAFPADLRTGVTVGTDAKAGDVTGDGVPDLLVGSGPGAAPTVQVYSGADGTLVREFPVFDPTMTAGVRVASAFITDDAHADVIVATGPGVPNRVQVYDGASIVAGVADPGSTPKLITGPLADFAPFGDGFNGGVSVGASNDPPPLLETETTVLGNELTGYATVVSNVYDLEGRFKWEYQVINHSYTANGYSDGIGLFDMFFGDFITDISDLDCSPGWPGYVNQIFGSAGVDWQNDGYHQDLAPSQSGIFSFTTDPRPIGHLGAEASDSGYAILIGGTVLGPQEKPIIEYLNKDNNVVTELRIVKWENAFEKAAGAINVKDNFIDYDDDRYRVRIASSTENKSANSIDSFTVHLSTIKGLAGAGTVLDTGNDITMVETGVNTGVFLSKKWLLLTSVIKDDRYAVTYSDGTVIAENNLDDATLLSTLDSRVKLDYYWYTKTADVKIKYKVAIDIYVLWNVDDNSTKTIQNVFVEDQLDTLNPIYAPLGIKFIVRDNKIIKPPPGTYGSLATEIVDNTIPQRIVGIAGYTPATYTTGTDIDNWKGLFDFAAVQPVEKSCFAKERQKRGYAVLANSYWKEAPAPI
jgi:hypothetical protein